MLKKIIFAFLVIFVLSSCNTPVYYEISQETEVYREFKMIAEFNGAYDFDIAKEDIWEHESLKAEGGTKVSLTGIDCEVSSLSKDIWHGDFLIDCVDQEYMLKAIEMNDDNNVPEAFGLYKDDVKIFESPMFQGVEPNPINKAQLLNGRLILGFLLMPSSANKDYSVFREMFWEGGVPSEFSEFEQIRAVFDYDDRIGFLATDPNDDMTYLYYDGEKVSPAYDSVRLITCCASDPHVYSLYSNGAFLLVGMRDGDAFFTEIDLS